ncbi:MFS transporter [Clostridium sp.]|uniref:MFS transporter n=1 Tax=Clostridium sp. TaxID=1506 RepID=UPI002628618B|nr:MFS transporter [Clostridium sp.]
MESGLVNLITNKNETWDKRWKSNCAFFILSYIFMGAVTGITNDSYLSYLNITVPNLVKALPSYAAVGTFVIAMILLLIHKVGYKKLILLAPLFSIAGLLVCIYSRDGLSIKIAYIVASVGIGMFDCIYPVMFTSYTPREERTKMFARVMYCNLISQSILTFFNGKIVVWKFAKYLGISYDKASILSENQSSLNSLQLSAYANAYKFVLWIAIILTIIATFFLLFLREKQEDYRETEEELKARKSQKAFDFKLLTSKFVVLWILIFGIIRFGASLVTPFFPIYLNNFLHISRGTVSTIITAQTVAMVLGYFLTPHLEKKLGSIVTIATTTILCVPLMLLMANGAMFGSNVAMIVGIILFLRSGVANVSAPIQGSLPLTFVSKNLVPAFNSLMLVVNSLIGFGAGFFTRYYLLKTNAGYGRAYYIAGTLYLIASILLLIVFTKKYNRNNQESEIIEANAETAIASVDDSIEETIK